MLPFLKNKEDAAIAGPVEVIEREHDDSFDMLDAVASDILVAVDKKDKALLKEALAALCEHLQDMDEQQDEGMMK